MAITPFRIRVGDLAAISRARWRSQQRKRTGSMRGVIPGIQRTYLPKRPARRTHETMMRPIRR